MRWGGGDVLTNLVGAMSWAFLGTMKTDYNWNISYVQVRLNKISNPSVDVAENIDVLCFF